MRWGESNLLYPLINRSVKYCPASEKFLYSYKKHMSSKDGVFDK